MILHRHKWTYYSSSGVVVATEEEAIFKRCDKCGKTEHKIGHRNQECITGYYWISSAEFIKRRKENLLYGQLKTLDEVLTENYWRELMKEDL